MLTLFRSDTPLSRRCQTALSVIPHQIQTSPARLQHQRILFAFSLDVGGINHALYDLLAYLRTHPGCLSGSVGGVLDRKSVV